MEQGYRRMVRRYPNSKLRVTKTCYPYVTKFGGLDKKRKLWIITILNIFSEYILNIFFQNFCLWFLVVRGVIEKRWGCGILHNTYTFCRLLSTKDMLSFFHFVVFLLYGTQSMFLQLRRFNAITPYQATDVKKM